MAFVSSLSLSYWRCAFLFAVAFFLIKSPELILFNSYVILFGEIFDNVVVDTLAESKNAPVVGIIAILLISNALSDLVAIFSISTLFSRPPILDSNNMKDIRENENAEPRVDNKELYFTYFENLVPLRLLFFFVLTASSYFSDNIMIGNNLVSIYGCVEIWFNFIIFNNLREEKVERYKQGYYTEPEYEPEYETEENDDDEKEEDEEVAENEE